MSNIYFAPSQKLPKKGDPGMLFGNIFVPLVAPSVFPDDGLQLYFDAEDIDKSDEETIDTWVARIGHRTFSSYVSVAAPVMRIDDGKKYVHLASQSTAKSGMELDAPFSLFDPCTIIFVLKQSVSLGPFGSTVYSCLLTNGGWGNFFAILGRQGSNPDYQYDVLYVRDGSNREFAMTSNVTLVASFMPFMLAAAIKGTEDVPDFYVNDQLIDGRRTPFGGSRMDFLELGALSHEQQYAELDVRAILYYNRLLSSNEVQKVYNHFLG